MGKASFFIMITPDLTQVCRLAKNYWSLAGMFCLIHHIPPTLHPLIIIYFGRCKTPLMVWTLLLWNSSETIWTASSPKKTRTFTREELWNYPKDGKVLCKIMVYTLQIKITFNYKNFSFKFCLKIRTDFPDNPIYYLNTESGKYRDISVINRAKIIDAFRLTNAHQFNVFLFWELTKYLSQETDYVAWYPMIKAFEYMSTVFSFFLYEFKDIKIKIMTNKYLLFNKKTLALLLINT